MAYNNIAWSMFLQKKYKEALKYVDKAIELDYRNSVAYDTRCEIYFALKDYDNSINDGLRAIELDSKIANSYFILGRSYYRKGDKEKACVNWSKAGENGKSEAYEYISKYCNN